MQEISGYVPVGRHTVIHPYCYWRSGLIPGWNPAPSGLAPRVIYLWEATNTSSYIKIKADQGSGIARIRRKNDADSIVRGMVLATRKPDATQAQYKPAPVDTWIPRGSWAG